MVCFALPFPWNRFASVGYLLFGVVLIRCLGRPGVGAWSVRLYRSLGVAALVVWSIWILIPQGLRSAGIPVIVLWTLFSGWSAIRLIEQLSAERRVTGAVLCGALAGYLTLGLCAGLLFCALETLQPGSFSAVRLSPAEGSALLALRGGEFMRLNYFAFVTLTTMGYGDILPTTAPAQMASVALAVIGTLYVAVVMGLLISRLMVQESRPNDGAPSP